MSELTRNKPSDYEVLTELFAGKRQEEELTDHQLNRLRRVRTVHSMMLSAESTFMITGTLMQTFEISQAQAFRDMELTKRLFGDMRKASKEFKRQVAEEMALETYRKARSSGDLKVMASATKAYIEATGCNIEDPDLPDFSKLQPNVYPIILAPEQEEFFNKLLESGGSINLSKFMNKQAEDAEYEEIKERADQSGDTAPA